jgi:hypothetical protein
MSRGKGEKAMTKTETKFKVFLPARQDQKAGMHPLEYNGKLAGKPRLFRTREEAERIGHRHHPKALAIPV